MSRNGLENLCHAMRRAGVSDVYQTPKMRVGMTRYEDIPLVDSSAKGRPTSGRLTPCEARIRPILGNTDGTCPMCASSGHGCPGSEMCSRLESSTDSAERTVYRDEAVQLSLFPKDEN